MATLNKYIVRDLLEQTMQNIKNSIVQNMSDKRRNASGRSVRSLKYTIDGDLHAQLEGDISFTWMERGRKQGKIPRGFHRIILKWIRDKGITTAGDERDAAWFISQHIRNYGTRLNGSFEDIYTKACEDGVKDLYKQLDWWLDNIAEDILRK